MEASKNSSNRFHSSWDMPPVAQWKVCVGFAMDRVSHRCISPPMSELAMLVGDMGAQAKSLITRL